MPDQPLGDRPGHLVVQALADHAEGQGVEPPLIGPGAEPPEDPREPLEPRADRLADQGLGRPGRVDHLAEHQGLVPGRRLFIATTLLRNVAM